jgi:hypothetical protein
MQDDMREKRRRKKVGALQQKVTLIKMYTNKKTPWPVVRKRTIPTERPSLVGEVSANFYG